MRHVERLAGEHACRRRQHPARFATDRPINQLAADCCETYADKTLERMELTAPDAETSYQRHAQRMTVDGIPIEVVGIGPIRGPAVVMLTSSRSRGVVDRVCERLQVAALHPLVVIVDKRIAPETVMRLLATVGLQTAVLVGDRTGGQLAWQLAAAHPGRFTGLVVIDAGHPGVADVSGVISDSTCPAVRLNTTAIVSTSCARAVARASQRLVYGDFRLAETCSPRPTLLSVAQVSSEIVLRTIGW